jgi:hypothetical protein
MLSCHLTRGGTQGAQDLGTKIAMGKKHFFEFLDGFSRKKYGKNI